MGEALLIIGLLIGIAIVIALYEMIFQQKDMKSSDPIATVSKRSFKNRHDWKLYRPSRFVRWIFIGPETNRAKRREEQKWHKARMRRIKREVRRESVESERKQRKRGNRIRSNEKMTA